MQPTIFGVLTVLLCGVMLFAASTTTLFATTLLLSLMGGSAAFYMSALGNSSVQPAILALFFLLLKCVLPGSGNLHRLNHALKGMGFLIVFVLYGAIGAWLLPRIFAGMIDVTPLRPDRSNYIYAVSPLRFSSQNITVSVYLFATLCAAICGYVAALHARSYQIIARTAAAIGITHAILGILGVLLAGTAFSSLLGFFRNGNYAQLDQSIGGFVRMNGIWPEPAIYAVFGFSWFVFCVELWLRDVETRWTGLAAALLGLALAASTSSTAYIGLAGYCIILVMRLFLPVGQFPATKLLAIVAAGFCLLAGVLTILALRPDIAHSIGDILARVTVDKAESLSGQQRAFWARQGIDAFMASYGIGVGAGSFRSSSLITAILGSMGIIGIGALIGHLLVVLQPLRHSTHAPVSDKRIATGAAASWASIVMLIPVSLSAASPDPGFIWGFMSGIALSLRRSPLLRSDGKEDSPNINQIVSEPTSLCNEASRRMDAGQFIRR